MMKKYIAEHWQLDLPDSWEAEVVDGSDSFYDPQSNGSLLFSSVQEDQAITDEYLAELAEEHIEAGAEFYDVEFGSFSGVTCCYEVDNEYWCEWYLKSGNLMLFVTYNCPLDEEGTEDDLVESILETLRESTVH